MATNAPARSSGRRRHPASALGVRDRSLDLRRAAAETGRVVDGNRRRENTEAHAYGDAETGRVVDPGRVVVPITYAYSGVFPDAYAVTYGLTYTRCNCIARAASGDGESNADRVAVNRERR